MSRRMVFSTSMALYPQTSSTSIYQELVRNANSHIPSQTYRMKHAGLGPAICAFTSLQFENTGLVGRPGIGARRSNADSSSGGHGPTQWNWMNSIAQTWGNWAEMDIVLLFRWCPVLYILFPSRVRSYFVAAVLVLSHICIPSTYRHSICSGSRGRVIHDCDKHYCTIHQWS